MTDQLAPGDRAVALYRAGHTSACVAAQIGRPAGTTRSLLTLAGVAFRARGTRCTPAHEPFTPPPTVRAVIPYVRGAARLELAAALKAKYEAGATIHQLAAEEGRSPASVTQLLHLAGTRMRPAGRPKTTPLKEQQ